MSRLANALVSFLLFTGCGSGTDAAKATHRCAKAESNFDTDDDGWTLAGDATSAAAKPEYIATEGSPGGYIRAKDSGTGGVWYFAAPAKYQGPAASSFR